jgi:hypothetical protein
MYEFVIKYWLQMAFAGLLSIGTFIGRYWGVKLHKRFCEHDTIKKGLLALLRVEIVKSYNYYMEKGYCPIYARDSINSMFREYLNLGGNSTIPDLIEELNNLPTDERYTQPNKQTNERIK